MWLLLGLFSLTAATAQDTRTIDGTGNNLQHPDWGAAFAPLLRVTPVAYADSISAIGHPDWPNPRRVSNEIFAQGELINDPMGLSDYCWVWGQFLDHDITFVPDHPAQFTFIPVPPGDPWMDPQNFGGVNIPMLRSDQVPGTGTGTDNPRQHFNAITAFIDGSNVYGSTEEVAAWLRTFENGKLKVSAGNLLPWNTLDGEYDSDLDPDAPHMDDAVGMASRLFVAGDVRANEQPLLASMHTLFVREHNRLCDEFKAAHPDWTDEQLYQHARRWVAGLLQSVTYNQFLPAMGVHPTPYAGYDPTVDPGVFNVFSAAAFRLGHTLLNSNIQRMEIDGTDMGSMTLLQVFFQPDVIEQSGGIECFFKGMGVQTQQAMDGKMVDDVRNFLFGPPPAGGLDLAAININRGRERGLPSFNEVRQAFGLAPLADFSELTDDATLLPKLEFLYGSPDALDPWVGMVCEKPMDQALFGTTIMEIMMQQFDALRTGDRFYYLNDPGLNNDEAQEIHETMLVDIIRRNTDIPVMQDDVFEMMPHSMLCTTDNTEADLTLNFVRDDLSAVGGVETLVRTFGYQDTVFGGTIHQTKTLTDLPTCVGYEAHLFKPDAASAGVTALDVIALRRHILQLDTISNPYRILAADVNRSGSMTALDIVKIRRVILGLDTDWGGAEIWQFIRMGCMDEGTCDRPMVENLLGDAGVTYVAVKTGDLNLSADPNLQDDDPKTEDRARTVLTLDNPALTAGETTTLTLRASQLAGVQGTLHWNTAALTVTGVSGLPADHIFHTDGQLAFVTEPTSDVVLRLAVRAHVDAHAGELFALTDARTTALAYDKTGNELRPQLDFNTTAHPALDLTAAPNPFDATLTVRYAPTDGTEATLLLHDATGRLLQQQRATGTVHTFDAAALLPGVYWVELRSNASTETIRVVKR